MPRIPSTPSQHDLRLAARKAFTLIELLVVISIIALLIALLMPALGLAREAVRNAACLNNVKQAMVGVQSYNSDHGMLPPSHNGDQQGDNHHDIAVMEDSWHTILINGGYTNAPTVRNQDEMPNASSSPFLCPSGLEVSTYGPNDRSGEFAESDTMQHAFPYRSTTAGKTYYLPSHYAASADSYYVTQFGFGKNPQDSSGRTTVRKFDKIRSPSELAAIYEGWQIHRGWALYHIAGRHFGRTKTNVSFFDGHAETYERESIPRNTTIGANSILRKHISADTLTGLFPEPLWRMDQ